MNASNIKLILIFVLSIASANSIASLKDKYKEQQKPKKVVIPQEVLDIRDDINNTWNAIRKEGVFYFLMDGSLAKKYYYGNKRWSQSSPNFTIYSDGRLLYKDSLKDVFPLYLVDNKIFIPLTTSIRKSGTPWKGKTIRCEKAVSFSRPAPVGEIDNDGIARFKMKYLRHSSEIPRVLSKKQEFEVNFDTKECYATGKYVKPVHKCHIANKNELISGNKRSSSNLRDHINGIHKRLYLSKKNLETCKVENK
jgi:hypothetical protein